MSYKIVLDSSADIPKEFLDLGCFEIVPLTLQIGDYFIVDSVDFDAPAFLSRMKASEDYAKSACPAPGVYMESYKGDADRVYVMTLSSKLSGSYNSALQGKNIFEEEFGNSKKIHVFDTKSAGGTMFHNVLKLLEMEKEGKSFEEIVTTITKRIDNSHIYFLLDNYENFRKNGRISNVQSSLLNALHIKLIMEDDGNGEIQKVGQDLSFRRALTHMCKLVIKNATNPEDRVLVVTHCANKEMGTFVINEITKKIKFKATYLLEGWGITTMYANEGGILVTY